MSAEDDMCDYIVAYMDKQINGCGSAVAQW